MKIVVRIFIVFFIGVFIIALLPWFISPVLNDIEADKLKQELQNAPLPQNTKIIEAISGSGNTGGTGNHTEIWAGILIKTELSEDDIYRFYGKNILKVDARKRNTFTMRLLGKDFSSLNNISKYDGYYIVERIDNAVSSFFDLRGH